MDHALRGMVRTRAGDRCEYCLLPQAAVFFSFQIDHITARQHGGDDQASNLALACDQCNRLKGPNSASIDPQSGKFVRLFHPRQQVWEEHFRLIGAEIEGRTEIGRATVNLLRMNVEERIELRQRLLDFGEFIAPEP